MKRDATAAVECQETEDAIHRVDTVPPPDSGDAYSAATQVRELPEGIIELLKSLKSDRDADLVEAVASTPAKPPVTVPPESGVVAKNAMYTQWEEGDADEDPPTRLCAGVVTDVLADSERAPSPTPERHVTIRPSAPPPHVSAPLGAATALFSIAPLPPLPPVDDPMTAVAIPPSAPKRHGGARPLYTDALIFTAAALLSAGVATIIAFAY